MSMEYTLRKLNFLVIALLSTIFLAGCDGGGGGNSSGAAPVVSQGQFIDSAVEGLGYVSGAQSGVTDANGMFLFEQGGQVKFMIGDVVIGQATAKSLMTPVDLVPGAIDETHETVANIARLLQTLDDDGNPDNGIRIGQLVRGLATGQSVDFDIPETDFEDNGAVQILVAELTGVTTAGARSLVSGTDARSHLRETLFDLRNPPPDTPPPVTPPPNMPPPVTPPPVTPPPSGNVIFSETWESASPGTFTASELDLTLISADAGDWLVQDSISDDLAFCGVSQTPQKAEIVFSGGSRALRLTSIETSGSCGDNVWVELVDIGSLGGPSINSGFLVPLSSSSVLSFTETGNLINPFRGSASELARPAGDTISLLVGVLDGNGAAAVVAYVLQRAQDRTAFDSLGYREVLLDPAAGSYSRNLLDDFSAISSFNPNGARVVSFNFQVSEHGSSTIDNILISEVATPPDVPPPSDPGTPNPPPPTDGAACPGLPDSIAGAGLIRVINTRDKPIEFDVVGLSPGFIVSPGDCDGGALNPGSYTLEITKCSISEAELDLLDTDCPGPKETVDFTIGANETRTITVTN